MNNALVSTSYHEVLSLLFMGFSCVIQLDLLEAFLSSDGDKVESAAKS